MIKLLEMAAEYRILWVAMAAYFFARAAINREAFYVVKASTILFCAVGYAAMREPDHSRSWVLFVGMISTVMPFALAWHLRDVWKDAEGPPPDIGEKMAIANEYADTLSAIRGAPGILVVTEKNSPQIRVASRYTSEILGMSHSDLEGGSVDAIQRDPDEHRANREGLRDDEIKHRDVEAKHSRRPEGIPLNLGVANVSVKGGVIGVAIGKLPNEPA